MTKDNRRFGWGGEDESGLSLYLNNNKKKLWKKLLLFMRTEHILYSSYHVCVNIDGSV